MNDTGLRHKSLATLLESFQNMLDDFESGELDTIKLSVDSSISSVTDALVL